MDDCNVVRRPTMESNTLSPNTLGLLLSLKKSPPIPLRSTFLPHWCGSLPNKKRLHHRPLRWAWSLLRGHCARCHSQRMKIDREQLLPLTAGSLIRFLVAGLPPTGVRVEKCSLEWTQESVIWRHRLRLLHQQKPQESVGESLLGPHSSLKPRDYWILKLISTTNVLCLQMYSHGVDTTDRLTDSSFIIGG